MNDTQSPWFSNQKNTENGWKLDVISLLAVIGESSVDSHIQVLTSSWCCILPRIIPAPQALLKPSRPLRLPESKAVVLGVHNGTRINSLNYFPELLHPIEHLPPFSFQVFRISHSHDIRQHMQVTDRQSHVVDESYTILPNHVDATSNQSVLLPPSRRSTLDKILGRNKERPCIPSRKTSPLNIVSLISFFWTCGLIVWATLIGDGTAIIALASISMVSSLVGLASYWKPELMKRPSNSRVPAGDVVIKTREAAFIVVKCNEMVARELYTGTETCKYYISTEAYRVLVGIGTVLLMLSVVLLGNCRFTMQAAIGLSYMILNGIFWAASLLNQKRYWDLSYYNVTDETPDISKDADLSRNDSEDPEDQPSYTRTLWYAIRETKNIDWIKREGTVPSTPGWNEWVRLAGEHARRGDYNWPAVHMRDQLVGNDANIQNESCTEETQERHSTYTVPPQTAG